MLVQWCHISCPLKASRHAAATVCLSKRRKAAPIVASAVLLWIWICWTSKTLSQCDSRSSLWRRCALQLLECLLKRGCSSCSSEAWLGAEGVRCEELTCCDLLWQKHSMVKGASKCESVACGWSSQFSWCWISVFCSPQPKHFDNVATFWEASQLNVIQRIEIHCLAFFSQLWHTATKMLLRQAEMLLRSSGWIFGLCFQRVTCYLVTSKNCYLLQLECYLDRRPAS